MKHIETIKNVTAIEAVPTTVYNEKRLGRAWLNRIKAVLGLPSQRRLAQAARQIEAVRHWEQEFSRLSDGALMQLGRRLRAGSAAVATRQNPSGSVRRHLSLPSVPTRFAPLMCRLPGHRSLLTLLSNS